MHGFVYLTDLEKCTINHPLFQRLRHIRQNDAAFFVYPSLNISRFEHSIGCVSVAGRMAANLVRSPAARKYLSYIGLNQKDFQQLCRLYALLHDVGHLPLSHLFETAFEDFAGRDRAIEPLVREWFGGEGFYKLHEASGNVIAEAILRDVKVDASLKKKLLRLMREKKLGKSDPLRPVKLLIDSEIDADRIDATARDGLLAGREYGTYDIDRLCSAVFLQEHEEGWRLAYSHKALGSIESLLLDRYRTHRWIHIHHRVVAMKAAIGELITKLLRDGVIRKESFRVDEPKQMALRDDIWLWSLIRDHASFKHNETLNAAYKFAIHRDKSGVMPLWKRRNAYSQWVTGCLRIAGLDKLPLEKLNRPYEEFLGSKLGFRAVCFHLRFTPVGAETVPLTTEGGEEDFESLRSSSALVSSLQEIWARDPQFYLLIFGQDSRNRKEISEECNRLTAQYLGTTR